MTTLLTILGTLIAAIVLLVAGGRLERAAADRQVSRAIEAVEREDAAAVTELEREQAVARERYDAAQGDDIQEIATELQAWADTLRDRTGR